MKQIFTLIIIFTVTILNAQPTPCTNPHQIVSGFRLSATNNSIRGYFTPTSDADTYLVFMDRSASDVTLTDGLDYIPPAIPPTISSTLVFLQSSSATAFVANNLLPGVQYYFYVKSANKNCPGGPKYNHDSYSIAYVTTLIAASDNYYFGNLHAHSSYSDGNKDFAATPANDYAYAKNSLCMDFLGISEHNHKGAGMHLSDWQPGISQALAARTSNFLSLYGQEWGVISSGGHVLTYGSNQLFGWEPNNYDVYVPKSDYTGTPQTTGTTGLFRTINNTSPVAFATLAHPQDGDFDSLATAPFSPTADSAVVGIAVESGPAFSTDSTYSDPPSYMYYLDNYRALLAKGYHVGPTIDHDNHYTTFGRTANSRLAVIAPSLDSASFYQAMRQRQFYASQACDTRVSFTINNQLMGSIFNSTSWPNIVVTASDPSKPTASVLIRIMKGKPGNGVLAAELARTTGVSGILAYSDTSLAIDSSAYYYADMSIAGKRTISSPIWYTRSANIFPVTLLNFTAMPSGIQQVHLKWSTATELNTRTFIIERSANGSTFNPLTSIAAKGSHSEYSFSDGQPYKPITYYRLKIIDNDGKVTYSNVVAVNFKQSEINSFSITPNPIVSNINLQIHSIEAQKVSFSLTDIAGRPVYNQLIQLTKGFQNIRPDVQLKTGVYFATIRFSTELVTNKLVKQ